VKPQRKKALKGKRDGSQNSGGVKRGNRVERIVGTKCILEKLRKEHGGVGSSGKEKKRKRAW